MKTILISNASYLPAFKRGGAIRTLSNIIEYLGDEFKFKIICEDRDRGDSSSYKNIENNKWQNVGKADVFYLSPSSRSFRGIKKAIDSVNADLIYLNSFFDFYFTIVPLLLIKLRQLQHTKVLLAPRGEFSKGALEIKKFKKYCFIKVAKTTKLYNRVYWQASSNFEKEDIIRVLNTTLDNSKIFVAPDLAGKYDSRSIILNKAKNNPIKVVFVSRITKKKNLSYALEILGEIKDPLIFNIYGPIDKDLSYWKKCKNLMSQLPSNIAANYLGPVSHIDVSKVFCEHDLFFFPSLGENYGHVIIESLSFSCPVLTSDQTPWTELEQSNAGWSYSLSNRVAFVNKLNDLIHISKSEYKKYFLGAKEYSLNSSLIKFAEKMNREMFSTIMS